MSDDLKKTFKFTAPEYAKMLGISTSALRHRRRRNNLEGEYVKIGSEYFYKTPPRDRPNIVRFTPHNDPRFLVGDKVSQFRPKKYRSLYNRKGGSRRRDVPYDLTGYHNAANGWQLQLTNDLRQKARIDGKLEVSQLNGLTDRVVEQVLKNIAKEKADKIKNARKVQHDRNDNARRIFISNLPRYEEKLTGRWYDHSKGEYVDYSKPKKYPEYY